jgi:hypothetical protein
MNSSLGRNVWWTVPVTAQDGIASQAVLEKHGFSKDDLPLPSRRTEVSRACYSFQNRQGKHNRRITEKAADDGTYVTYGILNRRQKADRVSFRQGTTVKLEKANGTVTAEGKLAQEVLDAVKLYESKIVDDDIRSFLRRVICKAHGIGKRPSGGIYFIPEKYIDIIKAANEALKEIGGGAKMFIEGIINGVQERQNIWGSVEEEIDGQIIETLAAVDRIERSTEAVKDQQAKLDGLKELAEVYQNLLGEEAKYADVAEKIEAAVKKVSEKMAKLQAGTAAKLKGKKVAKVVAVAA